jgi:hypothetical protein
MNNSQSDNTNNSTKRKETKAPAFQFYPADYLINDKIAVLTLEEQGAYIRAVCYCWKYGSVPSDTKTLASLICCGCSEEVARAFSTVFKVSSTDPTKLINLDLEKRRQEQKIWRKKCSDGGKRSAESRKKLAISQGSERKGTSTTLQLPFQVNGQVNGNSSSSSSSSDQIHIYPETETPPIGAPTEAAQLPLVETPTPSKPAKKRGKGKVKDKLTNLIDMTEAELISLGKHPSPLAPRHLTRKKEELEPQDDEASNARVWLTQSEVERLREKWGDEKLFALIERASQYFGIQPAKAKEYADHNLLLQNWEKR